MNALVLVLKLTVPLAVLVGAVKVKGSEFASVAVTDPVTTPVVALGVPIVVFGMGTVFAPVTGTVTNRLVAAPFASVTVTVTVSVVVAVVAPALAAACRAVAVGV